MGDEQAGWTAPPAAEGGPETPEDRPDAPEGELEVVAPDVAAMTFERALEELEGIVHELERGQLDLEAAIRAYERGTALKLHCEHKLKEAQLRVERISMSDGTPRAVPFDER